MRKLIALAALAATAFLIADESYAAVRSRSTVINGPNVQSIRQVDRGFLGRRSVTNTTIVDNGFNSVQTIRQVDRGILGLRRNVTEVRTVNAGGVQAIVQVNRGARFREVALVQAPIVHNQLLVDRHVRGELNRLNTFSYATNAPANIRFVDRGVTYYRAAPIVRREVVQYQLPPQAPAQLQEEACPDCQQGNAQYQTAPAERVIERVVEVPQRVVSREYVYQEPQLVIQRRQFIQHCR